MNDGGEIIHVQALVMDRAARGDGIRLRKKCVSVASAGMAPHNAADT
jgi:hypothetical protein